MVAKSSQADGDVTRFRLLALSRAWGTFGFVARGERLLATYLPESRAGVVARIRSAFPDAREDDSLLESFVEDVEAYFAGQAVRFDVGIDLSRVTPFRRRVLEQCRRIPYGRTASYGDLARAVGSANAMRAAGGAMAANPLPLVIPCHRVLASGGALGGFSATRGLDLKRRLLWLEGVAVERGAADDVAAAGVCC